MKLSTLDLENQVFSSEELKLQQDVTSLGVAAIFLREIRGRVDLSSVLLSGTNDQDAFILEKARNLIELNRLEEAQEQLDKIRYKKPDEIAEVTLERTRIYLFQEKYEQVLNISGPALKVPNISMWTRMTFLQLRGHALLNLNRTDEAKTELEAALFFARLCPSIHSAIAVFRFLVKAELLSNNHIKAKNYLDEAHALIKNFEPELRFNRTFTLLRAEADYYKHTRDSAELVIRLKESYELARYFDRRVTEQTILKELEQVDAKNGGVFRYSGWSYLPRLFLVINFVDRTLCSLENHSVSLKILNELTNGPLKSDELFYKVWGINLSNEKYALHLRQALSKLRKLLPKGSLRTIEDEIHLM